MADESEAIADSRRSRRQSSESIEPNYVHQSFQQQNTFKQRTRFPGPTQHTAPKQLSSRSTTTRPTFSTNFPLPEPALPKIRPLLSILLPAPPNGLHNLPPNLLSLRPALSRLDLRLRIPIAIHRRLDIRTRALLGPLFPHARKQQHRLRPPGLNRLHAPGRPKRNNPRPRLPNALYPRQRAHPSAQSRE